MKGYHKVRAFAMARGTRELVLPTGWKPFAMRGDYVIARSWHREEDNADRSDSATSAETGGS